MNLNNVRLSRAHNTMSLLRCIDGTDPAQDALLQDGQEAIIDVADARTITIQDVTGIGTDMLIESSISELEDKSAAATDYNWLEERFGNSAHLFSDPLVKRVTSNIEHISKLKITNESGNPADIRISLVFNKG